MYFLIRWLIRTLRRRAALRAQAPAEVPAATAPDHDESVVRPRGSALAAAARPPAAARPLAAVPARATAPKADGAAALSARGLGKQFGERVAFHQV
jgi:hypothetical protein